MKSFALALLGLILVAGGCGSTEYYAAPANATAKTSATVVGSRTNFLSLVRGVEASITRVDGKPVSMGGYDKPFLIPPGRHRVMMTAVEGPVTGVALVDFNFEAGRSYVVRANDIQNATPEIWLEDARTGQVVVRKFSADLRSSSPPPGS
jgi:hypothetical protein